VVSDESLEEIRHRSQAALNLAAATAKQKARGGTWVWDLKGSPSDAAPLASATGAVWLLNNLPKPARRSAYESRGVMTV
jgi:hypothetical protein